MTGEVCSVLDLEVLSCVIEVVYGGLNLEVAG